MMVMPMTSKLVWFESSKNIAVGDLSSLQKLNMITFDSVVDVVFRQINKH